MPSEIKWLATPYTGTVTSMNTRVGMTFSGANSLLNLAVNPPLTHVIFGDYTKWCSSLMFFPINVTQNSTMGKLTVGGATTDVDCCNMNVYHDFGYTLGQFKHNPYYADFRDYEPYTQIQIYLPFYGYIDVPIADIFDEYIQFRLKVDFATGQAVYIVGVNHESVDSPNAPFWIGTDDTYTRIIGTYSFNLGVNIPLGQTGMADTIRNMSMSVIKGATMMGTHIALANSGGTGGTSVQKTVRTARNPSTGRQITKATKTTTTEYDNRPYHKGRAITSAFETASTALENMSLNPSIDRPNNAFISDMSPRCIYIVTKRAIMNEADSGYNSLYGKPLGSVRALNTVNGYTEVTNIHFEGTGFSNATKSEIAMIEEAFSDGVILP